MPIGRLTAGQLVAALPFLAARQADLKRVEGEQEIINAEHRRLQRLVDELRSVDEVVDGVPLEVRISESNSTFAPLGDDLQYTRRADIRGSGEDYPPTKWILLLDAGLRDTKWREYDDRAEAEAAGKRYAVYGIVPGPPQEFGAEA